MPEETAEVQATGLETEAQAETQDAKAEAEQTPPPAGETQTQPEQKPGTPDKALQRVQQDLGTALRKIEELQQALTEKQTAPTGAEKREVQAAKRKAEMLREKLKAGQFNVVDDDALLAESVSEQDEAVESLRGEIDSLKKELASERMSREEREAAANWAAVRGQYGKVESETLDQIWAKAVEDAKNTIGEDAGDSAVKRLANKWFHERASAVQNSTKETAAAPAKPPVPASRARVSSEGGGGEVKVTSEDQAYLERARSLVRD